MPRSRHSAGLPARLVLLVLAGCLLLSGCTKEQSKLLPDLHQQVSAPAEGLSHHVTPRWEQEFTPASQPVIIGNTVVAYESRAPKSLELVGLDLTDGHQIFRVPASTGRIPSGSELSVVSAMAGETPVVVSLARPVLHKESNQYRHTIVITDPATGQIIREIDAGFVGRLEHCGAQVCAEVIGPDGTVDRAAIDLETGDKAEAETPQTPAPEMLPGNTGPVDGLFTRGSAAERTVGVMVAGEPQWELPVAELVGGEPVGDYLAARADPETQTAALTVRTVPGDENSFALSDVASVTVDLQSGESLWSQSGFSFDCNNSSGMLPCTGDLRWSREAPTEGFVLQAAALTMHGIEYGTGTDQWQTEINSPEPFGATEGATAITPAGYWLWRSEGKTFIGDVSSGVATEVTGPAWLACTTTGEFIDAEYSNPTQRLVPFEVKVSQPCSLTGETAESPAQFTVAGILAVAVQQPGEREEGVPGLYAVALPQHIAVYQ